MDIAIIDADLIGRKKHKYPNLACMKLSGYYKELGNNVVLKTDYQDLCDYDKVFISKVFTDTNINTEILKLSNVSYGGTGFYFDKAIPLPNYIEHHMPDYNLYDQWVEYNINEKHISSNTFIAYRDFSIGFTTRGCIRKCSFCVNQKYNHCFLHSPVNEFLDKNRKYIACWDDNVLACPDWKKVFKELNDTGKKFQFRQGLDERLLTPEKCEILFNSNWHGHYLFAFDNIKDKDIIIEKLKLIQKYTNKVPEFYCFCGYNHDNYNYYDEEFWKNDIINLFERIVILMKYHSLPYVTRHINYKKSPYVYMYDTIARWANQHSFIKSMSFREFCCNLKGQNKCTPLYLYQFEKIYPEIAKKYFDICWKNYN